MLPQRKHKYADRVSCTGAPKYFFIVDSHVVVFSRKCDLNGRTVEAWLQ